MLLLPLLLLSPPQLLLFMVLPFFLLPLLLAQALVYALDVLVSQRLQYPFIKQYTSNYSRIASMI